MLNSSSDLPISFKTVSEFRRLKSAESADKSISVELANNQTSGGGLLPVFELDVVNGASNGSCDFSPSSIESAMRFFDAECQSGIEPTAFVIEDRAGSALSEFMSKAVDFESAFEFADGLAEKTVQDMVVSLPPDFRAELIADDGNGIIKPLSAEDVLDTQEMPLPDEPCLASSRVIDQAAVIKDPQEASSITEAAERDPEGKVTKVLFFGGESVHYLYGSHGELVEFNYAGLKWKLSDGVWHARDRQTEYYVDAAISVLPNGSLRIEREDLVRILKLSGTRIDEHKTGSRTESRKLKNKTSPYDLLAKAKAENSVWLTSGRASGKHSGEQKISDPLGPDTVSIFDLADAQTQSSSPMVPSVAEASGLKGAVVNPAKLTCVPSAPIELRSLERTDKLRSLEEELLDSESNRSGNSILSLRLQESWLKACLWMKDRFVGHSSPKHLGQLDKLARLYFLQQRNDLAELTYLRALHIREQYFGKGQPELAASISGLAAIYEARANYVRSEEMYKEAISLNENGLRKHLFLFTEKVIDGEKLKLQFDALFCSIADLSRLYSLQGKEKLCAVVYEKALGLCQEICQREPACEQLLNESVAPHLESMQELSHCS